MPVVGIHAILLPTGKVLMVSPSARATNGAIVRQWDPSTGAFTTVEPPTNPATGAPFNIFCGGQTLLADGRVLFAGGNLSYMSATTSWAGLNTVFTFNPWNETWTRQPNTRHGRWYPTVTELPDGRAVIVGGWDETGNQTSDTDLEVFTPSADPNGVGSLRLVPTAARTTGLYPHLFVITGGNVAMTGPGGNDSAILDTKAWRWHNLPSLDQGRLWSSALLMPGGPSGGSKIMVLGGSDGSTHPLASSSVLDLQNPGAGYQPGPTLNIARAHLNTVILPDGTLATIGGGYGLKDGSLYADPVLNAELLLPGASRWRLVGAETKPRAYHSTALLLPDGRVLSAGDDRPGVAQVQTDKGEIYSPPYLFRGPRPTIAGSRPITVNYGRSLSIVSPNASTIGRVVLIEPGAVTHANDMSQRSIALSFVRHGTSLRLTSPHDPTLAPPGYYMLFVVTKSGIPSVARWVRLLPRSFPLQQSP